jgi:hypothetical protein
LALLGSLVVALALLGPLVTVGAAVGSHPSFSIPQVAEWAYGGTLEEAGSGEIGGIQATYEDHTNYAVVLNESNVSSTTISLVLTRVMGSAGFFTACYPNCSTPAYKMTGVSLGYEYERAVLVLRSNASVQVNGTAVPAYGLVSERLTMVGNISVGMSWQNLTNASDPLVEQFNATSQDNTTGVFIPANPLGLAPLHPAAGELWSSNVSVQEDALTNFTGATLYQGNLIPANDSTFAGSSTPISPTTTVINGTADGAATEPRLAGDEALALTPVLGGASLLEGVVLVPTSAYIFAAFSSQCDLAQRPCVADAATPELDLDPNATTHLGWDAAVSSISAFALRFDGSSVYDLPDGLPFWPASTIGAQPRGSPLASPTPTVTGLPIPVEQAEAVQSALIPSSPLHPIPPPPPSIPVPKGPGPVHGGRSSGTLAGTGPKALPGSGLGLPTWALGVGVIAAIAGAVVVLLARRRRGRPRPEPPGDPSQEGTEEPPQEAGSENDPLGYVW